MNATETPTENPALAGKDPPSLFFIVKWLGIILVLAVTALVIVGLFLPRQWQVEARVEVAADRQQLHALVADVEQWPRWMFEGPGGAGAQEQGVDMAIEAQGAGVGASVRWSGGGSRGEMVLVEADPAAGIRWDGKIESDTVNNHGQIRYEDGEDGKIVVVLTDTGELPPVFGGYFVPVMNAGLSQHFEAALDRLAAVAEATETDGTP